MKRNLRTLVTFCGASSTGELPAHINPDPGFAMTFVEGSVRSKDQRAYLLVDTSSDFQHSPRKAPMPQHQP